MNVLHMANTDIMPSWEDTKRVEITTCNKNSTSSRHHRQNIFLLIKYYHKYSAKLISCLQWQYISSAKLISCLQWQYISSVKFVSCLQWQYIYLLSNSYPACSGKLSICQIQALCGNKSFFKLIRTIQRKYISSVKLISGL